MPADKYRFVSPGVYITEVDQSQVPTLGTNDDGPVIIGRSSQGPSYRPTTVRSYNEFVQIFGDTVAGGQAGDVWRNGNFTTPMYATYAAKAYLANNNPITFVRLLGAQDTNASTTDPANGAAGWGISDLAAAGQNGAYGLFVLPDPTEVAATASLKIANRALIREGDQFSLTASNGRVQEFTVDLGISASAATAGMIGTQGTGSSVQAVQEAFVVSINRHTSTLLFTAASSSDAGIPAVKVTQTIAGAIGNTKYTTEASNKIQGVTGSAFGGGDSVPATGSLGAIFYCTGAAPVLSGTDFYSYSQQMNNALLAQVASGPVFKIAISGSNSKSQHKTFNFDTSSPQFIRKVFNTNPIKTNDYTQASTSREGYWLGETYEKSIVALGTGNSQAMILGLNSGSTNLGDFYGLSGDGGPTTSATGWFVSQDTNTPSSNFTVSGSTTQLFKLHGLTANGGETQNRVKVTIKDIRFPTAQEQSVDPYPTFTVQLRHLRDTDLRPTVLETYTGCNLNPNSQNYIGRLIGDKYESYNTTTQRLVEYGSYDNVSKYVRVEVDPDVAAGAASPSLAPFGVLGPLKFKSVLLNSGSVSPVDKTSVITGSSIWGQVDTTNTPYMPGSATVQLDFPAISLVVTGSGANSIYSWAKHRDAHFGVNLLQAGSNNRFDDSTLDLIRAKPRAFSSFVNGAATTHQYAFSLDNIKVAGQVGNTATENSVAHYQDGSRADGTSYTAVSGAAALVNTRRINKFTTVMFGGSDGLDIREGDPFRNTALDGTNAVQSATDLTNYARASVNRAINIISDAETTTYDLAAIPGVTVPALTNKLIEACEERGDALAVIDVEHDYKPVHEGQPGSYPVLPDITQAVTSMRSRTTNSSYGCAFYPFVQTRDVPSGQMLWLPPSVVGLGTLGSSAARSELWFAPAGFNRGGLSKGAGGVHVTNVRTKLTSQQRDDLYDVRINPIASFPTEGIVVFGQKTLQLERSALDRINVRRLMIFLKKKISQIANTILFDQNVQATWDRFSAKAERLLADVQARFGLEEYRLILDNTTTTPDLRDRNVMYAKVYLKPAKAIEFIALDFFITNSGASFED